MTADPRPSIAELQRLCRDDATNHDADLADAVPMLLEIAAAALAVRNAVCDGRYCHPHDDRHMPPCALMAAHVALDDALDKADPLASTQ